MTDLPRVIIKTPATPRGKVPNTLGTKVIIDGVEWTSVTDYSVGAGVHAPMTMTLTFLANVTIEQLPGGQCVAYNADWVRCLLDEDHMGLHVYTTRA